MSWSDCREAKTAVHPVSPVEHEEMGHHRESGGGAGGDGEVDDEDGLIDVEVQDEAENGSREVKTMHEPRLPSKEE
jgi:hypothetical protein